MENQNQEPKSIFSQELREKLLNQFLQYATFVTNSNPDSTNKPSTENQMQFLSLLVEECYRLRLSDIMLSPKGNLTATLPKNTEKILPTIGFIAHVDTSPDVYSEKIKPCVVQQYDGGDIVLNKKRGIILSPTTFPHLLNYLGDDIVVTDGESLLGADDKAGVVAILGAMKYLISHPEIEHGEIKIAFFTDEEIGKGSDSFDEKSWGCDWAYTIDGGEVGELQYENFNAASVSYTIQGCNVHPGEAKGKMINSLCIANELISLFPMKETPQNTEGYEGFYHLTDIKGGVETTSVKFLIRDFNKKKFEARKKFAGKVSRIINKKYPNSVSVKITDTYYNMKEKFEGKEWIMDLVSESMLSLGITPKIKPIRGGTDGAILSFRGLLCPNIFAGGENFHSIYEYLPVSSLIKASEVIVRIAEISAKQSGNFSL